MKGLKAVFRADASDFIGGGHIMRCLTLADALANAGWECSFACTEETVQMMPALAQSSHQTIPQDAQQQADLLIVDHYELDQEYEFSARSWADRIVVIDDLADRPHDCDVLMDQTFGREPEDYKNLVPDECDVLTGSQYALLRSQFSEKREKALKRRQDRAGKLENILVMLGAGDKDNVTGQVMEALSLLEEPLNVNIIMGANAPHLQTITDMAQSSHHGMAVHAGINDVASLMVEADLAIGAGGTATWERCSLGLPTMVLEIADNQRKIIQEIVAAGAAVSVGHYKNAKTQDIADSLLKLKNDPSKIIDMNKKAAQICDGSGAKRLVDFIQGEENAPANTLSAC